MEASITPSAEWMINVPAFGLQGVAARTDYVIEGKRQALVILTASKTNGKEGRLFCARTTDGGVHWKQVSWIGDEPGGFRIMPSTVKLPNGDLLTAARTHGPNETNWIDLYSQHRQGRDLEYGSKTGRLDRRPRREPSVDDPAEGWALVPDLRIPQRTVWHPRSS